MAVPQYMPEVRLGRFSARIEATTRKVVLKRTQGGASNSMSIPIDEIVDARAVLFNIFEITQSLPALSPKEA